MSEEERAKAKAERDERYRLYVENLQRNDRIKKLVERFLWNIRKSLWDKVRKQTKKMGPDQCFVVCEFTLYSRYDRRIYFYYLQVPNSDTDWNDLTINVWGKYIFPCILSKDTRFPKNIDFRKIVDDARISRVNSSSLEEIETFNDRETMRDLFSCFVCFQVE
jgi:hypothetical protein